LIIFGRLAMFLIRADGNARIGAGHLMRCLAIAEELAQLEGREAVRFICADGQSAALAREHGFESIVLGTDYRDMESELPLWREQKRHIFGGCVLLVDSYYITDRYLTFLRQFGYIALLDDMAKHCYPVDCVINYNAQASLEVYQRLYRGKKVKLLVGGKYVPLRRQFAGGAEPEKGTDPRKSPEPEKGTDPRKSPEPEKGTVSRKSVEPEKGTGPRKSLEPEKGTGPKKSEDPRKSAGPAVYKIREKAGSVLVTTGGGDHENIAGKILKKIYTDQFIFHLVIGRFNPHFQEMEALEKTYGNIHIHHNVTDMAGLMRGCDIAVTAGGSTIYELAAVGVPFICFSYAENQETLTEYIGREQIAGYAGAWHREEEVTLERIAALFARLVSSRELRMDYHQRERAMTDGRGAERLARELAGKGML